MIKKILFLLLITFSFLTFGQNNTVEKKNKFTVELKREVYPYLHASVYTEAKLFLQYFNDKKNKSLDRKIIQLHKLSKEKYLSVTADYVHIFRIYNAFYEDKIEKKKLEEFLDFCKFSLENEKISEVKKILSKLSDFLENEHLFEATTFKWYVKNAEWELESEPTPLINFTSLDLYCTNGTNNFFVKNTKAIFYLNKDHLIGESGNSIIGNSKKVNIGNYDLSLAQTYFSATNSVLFNKEISENKIPGTFTHRMYYANEEVQKLEPQFISSDIIPIKRKTPNLKIVSGVHVRGTLLDLIAPKGKSSKITFFKNNKKFVQLDAHKYSLEENRFYGKEVMFTLYLKSDSIMHPNIDIEYNFKNETMEAVRSTSSLGKSPFYDGLHELQILADYLIWEEKEEKLTFMNKSMSILNPVVYQSLRFFDVNWFIELFNFSEKHPTTPLYKLARKNKWKRDYYIYEVAEAFGYKEDLTKKIMIDFTNQGFVNYNQFEEKISIQDRFFRFYVAQNKKRDYDKIRFKSLVNNRPAAEINLKTGELLAHDVKEVNLSFAKQVSIHPSDRKLTVLPNMDFEFNGITSVGPFAFFGENQYFNYDDYTVNFNKIDSFRYLLESKINPEDTATFIRPCKTVLQELNGTLQIDKPKNKSFKKDYPQYPKLFSETESYVFYDNIKDGIYDKERFYFKAKPFDIDSLLFTDSKQLKFKGELVTTTIFDNIKEEIYLTDKDELGFERKNKENYKLYGNANFSHYLKLQNSGLSGNGSLWFNDTYATTDSIDFYPDYIFANINTLTNNSTSRISPQVKGEDLHLNWYREEGLKEFKTKQIPLTVNNTSSLNGGLEITDNKYSAYGTWIDKNVVLRSDSITLEKDNMLSKNADFKIFDEETELFLENEKIIEAQKIDIDFNYRKNNFYNSKTDRSKRYKSDYLHYDFIYPMITYERDQSEIYFEKNLEDTSNLINLVESKNIFTGNIKYDSPTTIIDMKNLKVSLIDLNGVKIADALIKPIEEELILEQTGLPNKLVNATISILNKKGQEKHLFTEAEVEIINADKYKAKIQYNYTNRIGEAQNISFDSIYVASTTNKSTGLAKVSEGNTLLLDPNMKFHGEFLLDSISGEMLLEGKIAFTDPCFKQDELFWTNHKDTLSAKNSIIKSNEKEENTASFSYLPLENKFKINFHHNNKEIKEKSFININGDLTFADSLNFYNYKSLNNQDIARFRTDDCVYELESFLNLTKQTGISDYSYGRFFFEKEKPDSLVFQSHIGLDFKLPKKALRYILKDFKRYTKDLETTYESSELFNSFINRLVGKQGTNKFFKAKSRNKKYVPKKMQSLFFVNDIDWTWNAERKHFEYYYPLELSVIATKRIDKIIDGYLIYGPREDYNRWIFYFKLNETEFYYFEIVENEIYTSSSNERYNKIFKNIKNEKVNKKEKGKILVKFRYPTDDFLKTMDK